MLVSFSSLSCRCSSQKLSCAHIPNVVGSFFSLFLKLCSHDLADLQVAVIGHSLGSVIMFDLIQKVRLHDPAHLEDIEGVVGIFGILRGVVSRVTFSKQMGRSKAK